MHLNKEWDFIQIVIHQKDTLRIKKKIKLLPLHQWIMSPVYCSHNNVVYLRAAAVIMNTTLIHSLNTLTTVYLYNIQLDTLSGVTRKRIPFQSGSSHPLREFLFDTIA